MYICSFTELKIHKFKNVNSFLGFLGSLSSWSLLFSVWKMNLEHWNYGLSFVWTLITLLFISTYNRNPGISRILNTFDSWIIKIKIIGDLKDIYFILHSLTIRICAIQAIFSQLVIFCDITIIWIIVPQFPNLKDWGWPAHTCLTWNCNPEPRLWFRRSWKETAIKTEFKRQ